MLSQRCVDDTAVEKDLGGIRDTIEYLNGLFVLLIVIEHQGQHPRLDFLAAMSVYSMERLNSASDIPASKTSLLRKPTVYDPIRQG